MRETRTYSDQEREEAVAMVRTGRSQSSVARELGIPLQTLNEWYQRGLTASERSELKDTDYAELWGTAGRLAAVLVASQLEMAMASGERLPARDVQAYAIAGGISTDKHLDYRDGRKGTSISVDARSLTLPPGLTLDELRAIAQPHNDVK